MSISHWPEGERPREKLLAKGAHMLSDAELLAIFLRTGCAGKSAVDLARDLLKEFKGLRQLLQADRDSFCRARGLGDAKYTQLQAVLEIAKRHLQECLRQRDALSSSTQVKEYLQAKLHHRQREIFAVIFLDNKHRLLAYEELFQGTIDCAHVHPREVAKQALVHNAAAVILAHNHPSGCSRPSVADRQITQQVQQALQLLNIRVLDHLVVGDATTSLAELGWL